MNADAPSLSLCMIVRDEEQFLPQCLESLKGVVDEVVIVDTGSTDRTSQIAREFGAVVFSYAWDGDFGNARNYSLDQAKGDWLLVMDPDEALHPDDRGTLKGLLSHPTAEGFIFRVVNFFGPKAGHDFAIDPVCRLFRNRPVYRYRDPIHEEIGRVILSYQSPDRLIPTDVRILHYGYLDEVQESKQKNRRNQVILQKVLEETSDDPAVLYCYGTELYQDGQYEKALVYLQKAWRACQGSEGYASDLCMKTALCYRELGKLPEAIYTLQCGIRRYPDFPDLHFLQGQLYYAMREYDEAAQAYQKAIAIGAAPPQYTAVNGAGTFRSHYALGAVYEAVYMYPEAIREYHRALLQNSHFNHALLALLRVMPNVYTPQEIKGYIEQYLQFDRVDSTLTLCELLASAGQVELANTYLAKLPDLTGLPGVTNPPGLTKPSDGSDDPARYWFLKGVVSFLLNRPGALEAFDHLEPSSRYWTASLKYRVVCYWALERWGQAGRILDGLEKDCSDLAALYRAFQEYQVADGKDESKRANLEEVVGSTPPSYIVELIDFLLTIERKSRAQEVVKLLPPISKNVQVRLAQIFERHGNVTTAQELVNAVLQQDAPDPSLWRLMAWWHIRRGDWGKGYHLLEAATAAAPTDVVNYLALSQFWIYRTVCFLRSAKEKGGKGVVSKTLARLLNEVSKYER